MRPSPIAPSTEPKDQIKEGDIVLESNDMRKGVYTKSAFLFKLSLLLITVLSHSTSLSTIQPHPTIMPQTSTQKKRELEKASNQADAQGRNVIAPAERGNNTSNAASEAPNNPLSRVSLWRNLDSWVRD